MLTHLICSEGMIIVLGSNFDFQGEGGFLISMELKGETPTLNDAKTLISFFFGCSVDFVLMRFDVKEL
jgi:hypothetical protein